MKVTSTAGRRVADGHPAGPVTEFEVMVLRSRARLAHATAAELDAQLEAAEAELNRQRQLEVWGHLRDKHESVVYIGDTIEIHRESHPECAWRPE